MREIIIEPNNTIYNLGVKEVWEYRELLTVLTLRDIKVRYKQTILGVAWILFQPSATTLIFSIFFGKIAKFPSAGLPYPLFVFTGLLIWIFFSNGVTVGSNSLFSNDSIIKKIYFPKIIAPISAVLTTCIDFLVTLLLWIIVIFYFHVSPSPLLLVLFPLLFIFLFMVICGVSFIFSALKAKNRDVRQIFPFILQLGMFVTPVIYAFDSASPYQQLFLTLNPLSGIIDTLRTTLTGSNNFNWLLIFTSGIVSAFVFIFGIYYFKRTERHLADLL